VGDAEFQKKCLGKMGDVTGEGRTVLFVSHNMGAVQRLCSRGLLLREGRLCRDDEIDKVVQDYVNDELQSNELSWNRQSYNKDETLITQLVLVDENKNCRKTISNADKVNVIIAVNNGSGEKNLQLSLDLLDNYGNLIFVTSPRDSMVEITEAKSLSVFYVSFDEIFLLPTNYTLRANLYVPPLTRFDRQQISFTVGNQKSFSNYITGNRSGNIAPKFNWDVKS